MLLFTGDQRPKLLFEFGMCNQSNDWAANVEGHVQALGLQSLDEHRKQDRLRHRGFATEAAHDRKKVRREYI